MQTIQSGVATMAYGAMPFTSLQSDLETRISTALTFTVRVIKADSSSIAGGGSVDQIDSVNMPGCRRYLPASADTSGYTGSAIVRVSAATMETREIPINIISFDPFSSPGSHGQSASQAIQNSETNSLHKAIPFVAVMNTSPTTRLDASALTISAFWIRADGTTIAGTGSVIQPDATNALGCCFYIPNSSEINVNGEAIIRLSASGMETREISVTIVPYDPYVVGSGAYPAISNATTAESIRDRIIAVISALVPKAAPTNSFFAYRNEGDGNLITFAEKNPTNAYRRFQVRYTGDDQTPLVSNTDYDERSTTMVITIAYPQNARTGRQAALDRDDTMDVDFHQIDYAVGVFGRANFSPPYPDAVPRGLSKQVEHGHAVDFLILTETFTYRRSSS